MTDIQQLQQKLNQYKNIRFFLITNPSNLNYLTKTTLFSDNNKGFGLISSTKVFLFVSPLIYEEVKLSLPNCVQTIALKNKSSFYRYLKMLLIDTHNLSLGFEENNLSWKQHHELINKLKVRLIPTKNIIEKLRITKDKTELKKIKKAISLTKKSFQYIKEQLKPGKRELELAWQMEKFLKEGGADDLAFPIIVASGPNSSIPHYQTGNRKLQKDDIVLIDAGCKVDGYCADITRTFFIGKPKPEWKKVYEIVKQAQKKSLKKVQPSMRNPKGRLNLNKANQIDKIARDYIKTKGYGRYFIHNAGHGLGLDIHELPIIDPKSKTILKPGMVFTIEPGIYIPGKFGIRIEDVVFI